MTISDNASSLWDSDEGESKGGSFERVTEGEYDATIVSSSVGPHPRFDGVTSWNYKLKLDNGFTTKGEVEIDPMRSKNGGPGKIKFAKWQLKKIMGFTGNLSELAAVAPQWIGTRVRVKLEDYRGNGYLDPTLLDKIVPGTSAQTTAAINDVADAFEGTVARDEEIVL